VTIKKITSQPCLLRRLWESILAEGWGVFFSLSFCGFLGHLISLVLAQFLVANISEMNICVERSCPCLCVALIVAFSCCLTLKIHGEEIFVGLDFFGV
jgi:hypothetical protein